mmetsp:Transcript_19161/g.24147  ORF Transcript_19161/g.24147 Transcript_19161/m.24147 type:complete len:114 (-) Transcript_19161:164-505(-)
MCPFPSSKMECISFMIDDEEEEEYGDDCVDVEEVEDDDGAEGDDDDDDVDGEEEAWCSSLSMEDKSSTPFCESVRGNDAMCSGITPRPRPRILFSFPSGDDSILETSLWTRYL